MVRAGVQPAALQSGLAEVLLKRGRGEGKTSNAGIVEIEPAPPKRKETLPTGKAEANKVTASQDARLGAVHSTQLESPKRPMSSNFNHDWRRSLFPHWRPRLEYRYPTPLIFAKGDGGRIRGTGKRWRNCRVRSVKIASATFANV